MSTPLKNMKVSWDDEIPSIWKVTKIHVPNHQPALSLNPINYFNHRWITMKPIKNAETTWDNSLPTWRQETMVAMPRCSAEPASMAAVSSPITWRKKVNSMGFHHENRWFPWDLSIKDMWWHGIQRRYPLVIKQLTVCYWSHGPVEIVDLPN